MSEKEKEKRWSEDEFGVITWHGYSSGSTYHHGGHDPFTKTLDVLNKSRVPEGVVQSAIMVHDDLDVARSIALSIFGRHWREHVMDVYDRMRRHRRDQEEPV